MLGRNRGGTSSSAAADRPPSLRQSSDSSAGPKSPNHVWTAMNSWFLEPLPFAQGKTESGEMPMDIDILSLLKKYSPHDLALYQHWGFIDPRIDLQGEDEL